MPLHLRPMLLDILQSLKASFWLIPLCMLLAALVIAPAIIELDLRLAAPSGDAVLPGVRLSAQGARMILSAIAGSMITVASLVFSMTLIALSLVAQQLGPRILQIFMEDRPTQIVLGLFIATFLYAMIVLGAVGFGKDDSFIPTIGVFTCAGLAVVAFVTVILFIHHIARQIQADVVIFKTVQKLREATESLSRDSENGSAGHVDRNRFETLRDALEEDARQVRLTRTSGYVQFVDEDGALRLAEKHDLQIAFRCRPGHFILNGRPVMSVAPAGRVDDDLARELEELVRLGPYRTPGQRVEFEMLALVEIALRALSKGINDPFTAISCIDWLSAALAKLMNEHPDYRIYCGENGAVRLLEYPQTFEHYLKETFDPIREAASDMPLVIERLDLALAELKAIAPRAPVADALDDQLAKLQDMRSRSLINR